MVGDKNLTHFHCSDSSAQSGINCRREQAAPTAPMGVLKGKGTERERDKHAGHESPFHTQFLDRTLSYSLGLGSEMTTRIIRVYQINTIVMLRGIPTTRERQEPHFDTIGNSFQH